MIDSPPPPTGNLYRDWRIEVKLRRSAHVVSTPNQLIEKKVSKLPTNSRMGILVYLVNTDTSNQLRSVDAVVGISNRRFARADSERAGEWVSPSAEFKRGVRKLQTFLGDIRTSCTRLIAHGLNINESVVPHLQIQAIRIRECQLPILLSTLGDFPIPTSAGALKSPTEKKGKKRIARNKIRSKFQNRREIGKRWRSIGWQRFGTTISGRIRIYFPDGPPGKRQNRETKRATPEVQTRIGREFPRNAQRSKTISCLHPIWRSGSLRNGPPQP